MFTRYTDNVSDNLLRRIDFRDAAPEVIDLSPAGGVVSGLLESKLECLSGDKVRSSISALYSIRNLSGFLSVLFSTVLPRTHTRVPVFCKWYTETVADLDAAGSQSFPVACATRAEATPEDSRPARIHLQSHEAVF